MVKVRRKRRRGEGEGKRTVVVLLAIVVLDVGLLEALPLDPDLLSTNWGVEVNVHSADNVLAREVVGRVEGELHPAEGVRVLRLGVEL